MDIIRHPLYPQVPRVRVVKPLTGFQVHIAFSDGTEKDMDLESYLHGPIFEPIRNDPQMFAAVHVDEEGDTLA
jgi:hypothetical protein